MDNKGFGLVSVLGIFLVAIVLIVSLLTLSNFQSNRIIHTMVEDQLELTAQNVIDMVAYPIEHSTDPIVDGMVPPEADPNVTYPLDITLDDSSFGQIKDGSASITRTGENVAEISVTVYKGTIEYTLTGILSASGVEGIGWDWRLQNYAK